MARYRYALLWLTLALAACSPSLNWREVRLGGGDLKALLPCKPDQATRRQSLAGYDVDLTMLGCEAGGGLYAISVVELATPMQAHPVQAQWQTNLLATLQAQGAQRQPFAIRGAQAQPEAVRLQAVGRNAEGRALTVQAVWFTRGNRLYHAALYAERLTPEMSEPFFAGMELP
ncbi:MAG: hypothetical protein ACK4F4_13645 [Hylemonella sp.]|jgi:hypothetical protein|uniref:hypothetical protein n=1 Tax=Hylemonella sp. TaxID=2066020 RepID=UPI00391AD396